MARLNPTQRHAASARENGAAGASSHHTNGDRRNGRRRRRDDDGGEGEGEDNDDSDDSEQLDVEQSAEDRRKIQREIRSLIEKTQTEQTRFLDVRAPVLQTVLDESEVLLHRAKQTTEVAVDAALVLRVSELALKRTNIYLYDRSTSAGIDLDEFMAKCADYMQSGRGIADARSPALSRSQRKRRRGEEEGGDEENADEDAVDDDDAEDDAADDTPLDWHHFGEYACLPRVRRPGLARFLPPRAAGGPDPDDVKARVVRRRAAALRLHELEEVRPQVLGAADLAAAAGGVNAGGSNNTGANDLTALAADVLQQLRDGIKRGQAQVQRVLDEAERRGATVEGPELQRLLDQHGLRSDGGVDLVRFAVNPASFAQTVENFFYISFLVRDGRAGLAYDDSGLPSIYPVADEEEADPTTATATAEDSLKKQLIFTLDMPTWREMIDTFQIERPMIPHRQTGAAASHPGGRAWFT